MRGVRCDMHPRVQNYQCSATRFKKPIYITPICKVLCVSLSERYRNFPHSLRLQQVFLVPVHHLEAQSVIRLLVPTEKSLSVNGMPYLNADGRLGLDASCINPNNGTTPIPCQHLNQWLSSQLRIMASLCTLGATPA